MEASRDDDDSIDDDSIDDDSIDDDDGRARGVTHVGAMERVATSSDDGRARANAIDAVRRAFSAIEFGKLMWLLTALVVALSFLAPRIMARANAAIERRDASDVEKLRTYAEARRKALDKAEEAMQRAAMEAKAKRDAEADEDEVKAKKIAEIDARAARLGVAPKGRGRSVGSDATLRREYSPLMGPSAAARGYRPSPRQRPGGGG